MSIKLFDANFYRAANSDLAGLNDAQALSHFQTYGLNEGRSFSPFVDLNFYRAANSDLPNFNNQQAFEHLQNYGLNEGRSFSQFFNINYYTASNPDLVPAGLNNSQLLQHFEIYGLNEGRLFSVPFDVNYYRRINSDLVSAGFSNQQLLEHFELFGLGEGRTSSPFFNVSYYLSNNSDFRAAGFNNKQAYDHFALFGLQEGRSGSASPGGDYAGNALSTAHNIALDRGATTFRDFAGDTDTNDFYRFSVNADSNVNLLLGGLSADADVEIIQDFNNNGVIDDDEFIDFSDNDNTIAESISTTLNAGTYYIHVYQYEGNTNYNLTLSATPLTSSLAGDNTFSPASDIGTPTSSNSFSSNQTNNSTSTSSNTASTASSFAGNANSFSLSSDSGSEGKFGDFNGYDDFQLDIKDSQGNVLETFSLTGNGYGEVFKDNFYEYVVFSGIDETTNVQISAINNIRFGDYLGSKLNVQTEGSITAGNITLQNTKTSSSPGLVLRSGLSDLQNSASGGSYKITDLGVLPGGNYSHAYDINNAGQIVGYSTISGGWEHAFLYSDGKMTDLGTLPGGSYSRAYRINNAGQVVGGSDGYTFVYSNGEMTDLSTLVGGGAYYDDYGINNSGQIVSISANGSGNFHAVLYSNGRVTDLGTLPGGNWSYANDINDFGQIIGSSDGSDDWYRHAFLYSNGQMTDLGTLPGGDYSYPHSINDSGQVVGESNRSDNPDKTFLYHAFLYSGGQMTDLGLLPEGNYSILPEENYSYALDINNRSQVVGISGSRDWHHAFLYSDGKMTDLNSLIPSEVGWILEEATAINDKGQIVGGGRLAGQQHAFLLDPSGLTRTPRDGITVGNISTLGDSISLQGLKITLTGSQITTKGGNITLDGPTILNSTTGAVAFNSTANSTDNPSMGNITFNNTVDGKIAGTQSLNLTAAQGNITFNNAVGSNAALKDLTVDGAKTVTARGDITTRGDITQEVIDDIILANLSTSGSGKVSIYLGKVNDQIYNSIGNVTVGSITAKEVDIMSDGGFTATGEISTTNSDVNIAADVNITALRDITVDKITTTNGGVSLISGAGAITATGEINSDNGLVALARLNITTDKIHSVNDAIILSSNQGAVTVNGAIASNGDVSFAALKDVVAQDITSLNGGVALISHSGTVTANGALSSVDNVQLGAALNVVAQNLTSTYGTVALVSTSGTITANGEINGGSGVAISANQGVTTSKISSQWGTATLIAEQGKVTTTGDVTTHGDIYISAVGDVNTQNVISNGGAITIASAQRSVTTGFLRSDGSGIGGKIYVQAAGSFRATGSILINGTNYSIYTGTNNRGSLRIVYGSGTPNFQIADASSNGTVADVSAPLNFKPKPPRTKMPTGPGWLIIPALIETIRDILDAGPTAPAHIDETNPITGKQYREGEYELISKLTPEQERRLRELIYDKAKKQSLREQDLPKAKVENSSGCFYVELDRHLGGYGPHNVYATWVTGSKGDFLMIAANKAANYAFYDGEVKEKGRAFTLELEPLGSLAEVKTAQYYLIKAAKGQELSQQQQHDKQVLELEVYYRNLVAELCGRKFFLSFDNRDVALAAASLYKVQYPNVEIHYIKPGYPSDVYDS